MYLLPKIHQRLDNVPGRPVVSNNGTPTEKVSRFLDDDLKPVMQNGWSYIQDSGDFFELNEFMADFNVFNPNVQITYESSKEKYCLFRSWCYTV